MVSKAGEAVAEQAAQMGADLLGGAFSGGIMSGGSYGYSARCTHSIGKQLEGLNLSEEDAWDFIQTGLESDPKTEAYQIADKLQKKILDGQKLSRNDLSRLYQTNT